MTIETQQVTTPPAGTPAGTEQPAATPTPAAPATPPAAQPATQQAQPGTVDPKTVVLPSSSFKTIKQAEREKGSKAAKLELAHRAGFTTVEAFEAALPRLKQEAPPALAATPPAQPPAATQQPDPNAAHSEAVKRLEQEKAQLAADFAKEQAEKDRLRAEKDALEAEYTLREAATKAGVKDVGYALHLYVRAHEGKTEEELKGQDEAKFFEGLKATHPYLFNTVVQPATTGVPGGTPPAPKPGEVNGMGAEGNKVDVMKMTQREYQEHLRKRGLNPHL